MGALRRSISPGFSRPGGDLGGFAGMDDVLSKNENQTHAEVDMRFAHLADVCEMSNDVLGVGGFGEVRRARHKLTNAECAVKTISKKNEQAAASSRHEAQVLEKLDHSHVCKLLDSFEDEENSYLVLELVQGTDLCNSLNNEMKCDERSVANIMRQILEVLAYCHKPEIAVIHRDLKPENIMLQASTADENNFHVKLIDFGLAVQLSSRDFVQTDVVGTEEFLAPEACSKGVYARATDMWSAGVILHMLLTGGALPNDGCVPKHEFSETCANLLEGLLREDPSRRLTAVEACQHSWITSDSLQEPELSLSVPAKNSSAVTNDCCNQKTCRRTARRGGA